MPDLVNMSIPELGITVIGAAVVFSLAGVLAVRRVMRRHVVEGHNDVLVPIFLTAGTIYAVLIGFLVIALWESYSAAKENVAAEASALTTMYRETAAMPEAERTELRASLREYAEAVVKDEWDLQVNGGESPKVDAAIGAMYGAIGKLPQDEQASSANRDFVSQLSVVASDRNRRTLTSNEALPGVLWFALVAGGILVIAMTWMLYMERRWPHVVLSTCLAAMIGMLLFVAMVLDTPFGGQLALTPEPFEHAVTVFDGISGGTHS